MRTECPVCPPWVVRCAHFDGHILILAEAAETFGVYIGARWIVNEGVLRLESHWLRNLRNPCFCSMTQAPSRTEADAEFDREAELLAAGHQH